MTGMSISWQSIAAISSRTIWAAFWCARQPAGSHDHRPAPTWRARPARTISLCERASASAGACFSVGRTSELWRVNKVRHAIPELPRGYRVLRSRRTVSTKQEPMSSHSLAAATLLAVCAFPAAAHAAPDQVSIMQDDDQLVYRDDATRDRALTRMKALGVDVVRATVLWRNVASGVSRSQARRRDLSSPKAYGVRIWNRYDNLVRAAQARGLRVYFSVTGPAPDYAHARAPSSEREVVKVAWRPSPQQFGKF